MRRLGSIHWIYIIVASLLLSSFAYSQNRGKFLLNFVFATTVAHAGTGSPVHK
jgi:hypothetical protein